MSLLQTLNIIQIHLTKTQTPLFKAQNRQKCVKFESSSSQEQSSVILYEIRRQFQSEFYCSFPVMTTLHMKESNLANIYGKLRWVGRTREIAPSIHDRCIAWQIKRRGNRSPRIFNGVNMAQFRFIITSNTRFLTAIVHG